MSKRDSFKGSGEGWEGLVGGLVKNPPKNKNGFDDGTKNGDGRPKDDGQRYRKPVVLPPARKENNEENKMTGGQAPTRLNPADNNMEPCPVCGNQKYRETTFTEGGVTKTVKVLVCKPCSDRYKQYQEGVKAANIKFLVANPTAPEPAGPMGKFQWVLRQIDLDKFRAEAQTAEATYRTKYDEVVTKVLVDRGYLVVTPEWKGTGTSRPVMRFTNAAYNGNGPDLKQALEDGLNKDLRWAMRKATGRLETATRVKAELEAELAKKTPPPATQPTDNTGEKTDGTATEKAKPLAKKPRKKQQ